MYVRREAVLSSQIEGTESSLDDVLGFELDPKSSDDPRDVEEVVNYVAAMNYGLERIKTFPLSLRLIREIHERLLQSVRGADKQPGQFRTSQNWIRPANIPLSRATFVPPPPSELMNCLDNFEKFLHVEDGHPVLIDCGLAHAQFETIHPFLDGNGRVGRLLITILLCHRGVLDRPLLYLSHYLKLHRSEYYDRLTLIRDKGDWEGWLQFFLRGVAETADEATNTGLAIVQMREEHRTLMQRDGLATNSLELLDLLFQQPLVNANLVRDRLGVAYNTANRLIGQLEKIGILNEITGEQRNRRYAYTPYIALFDDPEPYAGENYPLQITESEEKYEYTRN
jgi:Fic family protein